MDATDTLPDDEEARTARRREALRDFIARHDLRPHAWATKAGVSSGSIYAFVRGKSAYLSTPVAEKLARVVGTTVAAMLGEDDLELPGTTAITHVLRGHLLSPAPRSVRRRAPVPRDARTETLRVAEVQSQPAPMLTTGSLIYWHAEPLQPADAVRRICVVTAGEVTMIGDLRRGYGEDRFLLVGTAGEVIENAEISEAFPVEWIRLA